RNLLASDQHAVAHAVEKVGVVDAADIEDGPAVRRRVGTGSRAWIWARVRFAIVRWGRSWCRRRERPRPVAVGAHGVGLRFRFALIRRSWEWPWPVAVRTGWLRVRLWLRLAFIRRERPWPEAVWTNRLRIRSW